MKRLHKPRTVEQRARRIASNLRYYDKTRRKVHAGKLAPLCKQRGPIGGVVTCKSCLMVQKALRIGSRLNEWERKRLDALFRKQNAEKAAEWRRKNPEKARAAGARYRERYRDVRRVTRRLWGQENRDYLREYQRRYREARA